MAAAAAERIQAERIQSERIQALSNWSATGQCRIRARTGFEAESEAARKPAWTRSASPSGAGSWAINRSVSSDEPGAVPAAGPELGDNVLCFKVFIANSLPD